MTEPSQDLEQITLEAELVDGDAEREIAKAVSGRQAIARKYVRWVRRRSPGATPAEIIRALERHYVHRDQRCRRDRHGRQHRGHFVPGGQAGVKAAAIGLAMTATTTNVLPAADEQLKFEITAMFGLALADVHGMRYDQDQAKALVYGLSNSRVSQAQITSFASDLAIASPSSAVDMGQRVADGRGDWSHWASTLAGSLPGDGRSHWCRASRAAARKTSAGGLASGGRRLLSSALGPSLTSASRFVFGREVVRRAQDAFPAAPEAFPGHLAIEVQEKPDKGDEPDRALLALESAAQATGSWVGGAATAVGSGVAAAASTFRDGAKQLGTGLAGLMRPKQRGPHDADDQDD